MDGEERSKREERGGGLAETMHFYGSLCLPRDRLALGLTPAKMDRRFHSLRPRGNRMLCARSSNGRLGNAAPAWKTRPFCLRAWAWLRGWGED